MSEFAPITTVAETMLLDESDITLGYFAGLDGEPEPVASSFSRAFMHGWKNGAVDGGHRVEDVHQVRLCHAFAVGQSCSDARSSSPSRYLPVQ